MVRRFHLLFGVAILAAFLCFFLGSLSRTLAQLQERPGGAHDDPIEKPRDLTGCSIKNPRIRVVHTTDPSLEGGSMYLQAADPWLGYQWGRSLLQREFRERDGVYGGAGKLDGPLLADGKTRMMSRSEVNSCALCHNTPYRDGGAGATMAKNGGEGRNTPHMFGAGLVEMIGQQIRLQALAVADANRDGWISPEEAKGKRCILSNLPDGLEGDRFEIDYGSFEDLDGDGKPDLNPLFSIIYVDAQGKRLAKAKDLRSPGVAGYTFEVQCFGFGHLAERAIRRFRLRSAPSLQRRLTFTWDCKRSIRRRWTTRTAAVSPRFPTPAASNASRRPARIAGSSAVRPGSAWTTPTATVTARRSARAISTWPNGTYSTIPPAQGEITPGVRRGEQLFKQIGCAACHVPDWRLHAADPQAKDYTRRYSGDRRFFELQGRLQRTSRTLGGEAGLPGRQEGRPMDASTEGVHGSRYLHRLQIPRSGQGLLPDAVRRQSYPQVAHGALVGSRDHGPLRP